MSQESLQNQPRKRTPRARRAGREPRIHRLTFRLTERELEVLRHRASSLEMNLSKTLRRAALGKPLRRDKIPALNLRAIGDLGRIGNNLNQLVKLAHMGRVSPGLGALALEVRGEVERLREELAGLHSARGGHGEAT